MTLCPNVLVQNITDLCVVLYDNRRFMHRGGLKDYKCLTV
jgi:hypothetical protein